MSNLWTNRITGYGTEAPEQLVANPRNWRIHPKHQQAALAGSLNELGWIQNVIVNRRTGYVLDGHARVALALRESQPDVPVTYVDLSEPEEALALATLDPISAMAGADKDQLEALLAEVDTGEAGLQELIVSLGAEHGIVPPDFAPVGIDEQGRLDEKAPVTCPECGHVF